eukprot:jgi/Picsp_1/1863/NSC_05330-R1_protein
MWCSRGIGQFNKVSLFVQGVSDKRPHRHTLLKTSVQCASAYPRQCIFNATVNNDGSSPPSYNPQNTDQPTVLPSPEFDPVQTVSVQLDALRKPDEPWANHGIQLAYEFGYDIGGLDRSMYFGFPKDLYHLDHFMGQFANQLGHLVGLTEYTIRDAVDEPTDDNDPEATWKVWADVVPPRNGDTVRVVFHLRKKRVGSRKGSYMTYMIETVRSEE